MSKLDSLSLFQAEAKALFQQYLGEVHKLAEYYRQNRAAAAEIKDFHSAVLKQKSKKLVDTFAEVDLKYGEKFKELLVRHADLQEVQKRELLLTQTSQFHEQAQIDLNKLKEAAQFLLVDSKARYLELPENKQLQRIASCTYEMILMNWIERF
jgi:hypothetical protein